MQCVIVTLSNQPKESTMNERYIFSLIQPCKNRGVEIVNNNDGSILLDGIKFKTIKEAEHYLESKPRVDI
jgi:hypothetical protein